MNAFVQLLRDPRKIVKVWAVRRSLRQALAAAPAGRRVAWAFNIAGWKREYLQACFPEFEFRYISFRDTVGRHSAKILAAKGSVFIVWGLQQPEDLESFAAQNKIQVLRMEDGFLRSVGLGANHVLPYSVCIDQTGLYCDSRRPSDLETLLSTYDFDADPALMQEAAACLAQIRRYGLTKYNEPPTQLAEMLYGQKRRGATRILVIGQVEDDLSVVYGCDRKVSNNDVVRLAAEENPGAQIIYKLHPDVLAGKRSELSNPEDVARIALIVRHRMSLVDALTGVDRVYTISSLGGMEALMRGVPVTTLGAPFYAGWGLTDTRQASPRRKRSLTLEQLFAGVFLKYAKYFDPQSSKPLQLREVIEHIVKNSGFEPLLQRDQVQEVQAESSTAGQESAMFQELAPGEFAEAEASPGSKQYLVGFGESPELLKQVMDGSEVHIIGELGNPAEFRKTWMSKLRDPNAALYVWEDKLPAGIRNVLREFTGKRVIVRSGFIHQLGIEPVAFGPFAWSFEEAPAVQEAGREAPLLGLLNRGLFAEDQELLERAEALRVKTLEALLLKGQGAAWDKAQQLIGPAVGKRILVLGQPEDHALVKEASVRQYSCNDLVAMARMEHPGAQIIYRPDVANMKKMRPGLSDPQAVSAFCSIVPPATPVSSLIDSCDHVYTISHPAGFEAILRGKQLTLLGVPFFAGWGLSENRHLAQPRERSLSPAALFAGACIASCKYIDPVYKTISHDPVAALGRLLDDTIAQQAARVDASAESAAKARGAVAVATPAPQADAQDAETVAAAGDEDEVLTEQQLIDRVRELSSAFLHQEAAAYARLLVRRFGDQPENLLLLARSEMDAGNNDESIAAYTKCIELAPSPKVYAERARAKIQTGQFDDTVRQDYLQALARAGSKDTGIVRDYFNYCWESSPVSESLTQQYERYLSRVRKELPLGGPQSKGLAAHPKLFSTLGSIYAEIGNVDGALSLYQEATKRNEKTAEFLGLRCLVRRYGDPKAVPDNLYSLWQAMEQNQRRFRDLVIEANGEVAIVGNAPTEIGSGNGSFIDSRKLVVRFNSYDNEYPHSLDYGTKTNVWVRIPASAYVKSRGLDEGLDLIMFTGSNRLYRPFTRWGSILQYHETGIPVTVLPAKPVYELISRLNAMPSAGLTLCYMLYKIIGPLRPENYFGFSFLEDPGKEQVYHYSDLHAQVSKRHQMDRESEVFKSLLHSADSRPSYFFAAAEAAAKSPTAEAAAPVADATPVIAVPAGPEEDTESEENEDAAVEVLASEQPEGIEEIEEIDEAESADEPTPPESVVTSTVDGLFERVLVTSKGLLDYELFGCKPELIPRGEIAALDAGQADLNDAATLPVLSQLADPSKSVVVGFGLGPTGQLAQTVARHTGAPLRLAEYGLISSKHLPSEKQYNFSLLLDESGVFYDSTRSSSLEDMLNYDQTLASAQELDIARQAVRLIKNANITKYNNSPAVRLPPKRKNKRRILVIDQVAGDLSITFGRAEAYSFQDMLRTALDSDPEAEVYVKIHPEAVAGAKPANFTSADLSDPRVIPIRRSVNIISLIKQVDEVYVMTSGVGFEALVLEKTVTCFGFPYYAGWGLTRDMVAPVRRHRQRSMLELFVAIHLRCSIYFNPDTQQPSDMLSVLRVLELFNRDFFRDNPELTVDKLS